MMRSTTVFIATATAHFVLISGSLIAQTGGSGGSTSGESGDSTGTVTIKSVLPAKDLPIGKQVVLTAEVQDVIDPRFRWDATCYSLNIIKEARIGGMETCDFTPEVPGWNGPEIKDVLTYPGTQRYRVYVNSPNGPTDLVDVKFHEPNEGDLTVTAPFVPHPLHPLDPDDDPFAGDPVFIPTFPNPLQIAQSFNTVLKWDGQELGKCAAVCFKERISCKVNESLPRDLIGMLAPFKIQTDYIPANCQQSVFGGSDPGRPTMHWASPTLYDLNWHNFSYNLLFEINKTRAPIDTLPLYPVGTVLATKEHEYLFYGNNCLGFSWRFNKSFWLNLVVENAVDAHGTPIPIPNTNPPRNFKIPVWRITTAP
jgi:hypothetical protein